MGRYTILRRGNVTYLPREELTMATVIDAPLEMMEAVAGLRLAPKADRRLQDLMDRNN